MVTLFFFFCPFFLSLSLSGGYFPACSWFCFTGSQVFSSSLCSFLKPSPVQLAWQRPKAAPHNAKASSGHWVDWQIHSVKSRQKPGGELCQLHLGKLSVWWPCHLSPNMLVRFTKAVIHSYSFFGTIIVLKKKKKLGSKVEISYVLLIYSLVLIYSSLGSIKINNCYR